MYRVQINRRASVSTLTFDGTAAASNEALSGTADPLRVAALAMLSIRFVQGFFGAAARAALSTPPPSWTRTLRTGWPTNSRRWLRRLASRHFYADAGTGGQPISTTHPDPARIV